MKLYCRILNIRTFLRKHQIFLIAEILVSALLLYTAITKFYVNSPQLHLFAIVLFLSIHITIKITKNIVRFKTIDNIKRTNRKNKLLEKKREDIILEAGRFSSWQLSCKAGILKLDSNAFRILKTPKIYYTFEELQFYQDIKKIIDQLEDGLLDYIDHEVYIPQLKKWFIVRGRCVEMDSDFKPNQFIGVILDNTERRNYLKKLEHLSITDELTGLKNRRYFFEHFQRELYHFTRKNTLFTLAIFDLDYFKVINDTWGHLAGDYVLKHFSNILIQEVRPYDLVARFGGEEFVVLFPDINKEGASHIVERIKKKLRVTKCIFEDNIIDFTFSCGIGDSSELGLCTENEFVSIIDERLYEAKESGRNLIVTGGL